MDNKETESLLERYADMLSEEEMKTAIRPEIQALLQEHALRESSFDRSRYDSRFQSLDRRTHSRRWMPFVSIGGGIVVVAACLWFLFIPRDVLPHVIDFKVGPPVVRSGRTSEPLSEFQLSLSLNQDSLLRVIVIDNLGHVFVMPFDDRGQVFVRQIPKSWSNYVPVHSDPNNLSARAARVILVLSSGPEPSGEQLMQELPDTIESADSAIGEREIAGITAKLESEFNCIVRSKLIPAK